MPTVTQLIEGEEDGTHHIFESILQIMLSYVKFGQIKYGDEPLSDPRIQTVFGLITDMDHALQTRSGKERLSVVNRILICCWEYVKDFCEVCKERQEEATAAGGTETVAETLAQVLQSISGGSTAGEGMTAPVDASPTEDGTSSTAGARAKTHAEAEKTESEDEEKSGSSGSGEENEDASESEGEGKSMSGIGGGKQETSAAETGRMPLTQTEDVSEPVGGSVERDEDYKRESYDRAASDIERILESMATKAACEQLENERLQTLNEAAQSISYGNIHQGVNIRVNRIASVDEELIDQYNTIAAPLISISKQLQKSLIRQLEDYRRGGKQTGLMMGRRLDSHALHRQDGKVFSKNALPNETPELAVGLLLDESGSMRSYDRCTYARASAIILYDFCRSLDIPVPFFH